MYNIDVGRRWRIVLGFSYTCALLDPPTSHCARFFIHICPRASASAPMNSLFHTHLPSRPRQHRIVLGFSYTFALLDPPTSHCARFFIHMCSSPPASAPMNSLFHSHLPSRPRQRRFLLGFSYTFDRPACQPAPQQKGNTTYSPSLRSSPGVMPKCFLNTR